MNIGYKDIWAVDYIGQYFLSDTTVLFLPAL